MHIPPGQIVSELSGLLNNSVNGSVTVYQSNVSGLVDVLVTGAGTGTVFTSIQAIKGTFRRRDRNAGGLS